MGDSYDNFLRHALARTGSGVFSGRNASEITAVTELIFVDESEKNIYWLIRV
jgi:hypothetical protein